MAIMNAGQIEDVLGLNAHENIGGEIYKLKGIPYERFFFRKNYAGRNGMVRILVDGILVLQRLLFVGALVWLAVVSARGLRKWKVQGQPAQAAWILVLWLIVPLLVFWFATLWAYLTYFVILYPSHFLACGAGAEWTARRLKPAATYIAVAVLVVANVVFMLDYYDSSDRMAGHKARLGRGWVTSKRWRRFLAEKGGTRLRAECETELQLATARTTGTAEAVGAIARAADAAGIEP